MAIKKNQINRQADGFLSLLRGKVGGQGPASFTAEVDPVIDITKFLEQTTLERTALSTTGGSGDYALTVPATETWVMHNLTCMVYDTITAIYAFNGYLYVDLAGAKAAVAPLNFSVPTTPSGSIIVGSGASWNPAGTIVLPPGTEMGATFPNMSSSSTIFVSALYGRLDL